MSNEFVTVVCRAGSRLAYVQVKRNQLEAFGVSSDYNVLDLTMCWGVVYISDNCVADMSWGNKILVSDTGVVYVPDGIVIGTHYQHKKFADFLKHRKSRVSEMMAQLAGLEGFREYVVRSGFHLYIRSRKIVRSVRDIAQATYLLLLAKQGKL